MKLRKLTSAVVATITTGIILLGTMTVNAEEIGSGAWFAGLLGAGVDTLLDSDQCDTAIGQFLMDSANELTHEIIDEVVSEASGEQVSSSDYKQSKGKIAAASVNGYYPMKWEMEIDDGGYHNLFAAKNNQGYAYIDDTNEMEAYLNIQMDERGLWLAISINGENWMKNTTDQTLDIAVELIGDSVKETTGKINAGKNIILIPMEECGDFLNAMCTTEGQSMINFPNLTSNIEQCLFMITHDSSTAEQFKAFKEVL